MTANARQLHLTFNAPLAARLTRTLGLETLALPLAADLGDPKRWEDPQSPTWALAARYADPLADPQPQTFAQSQAAIARLDALLATGRPLTVWWSAAAADQAGFMWLCDHLPVGGAVQELWVPLRALRQQGAVPVFVSAREPLELPTIQLEAATFGARPLAPAAQAAYAAAWAELVTAQDPLRVSLNGRLVGVSADFYDRWVARTPLDQLNGELGVALPRWWWRWRQAVQQKGSDRRASDGV